MAADPEVDEAEEEEVGGDVVGADVCGCVDVDGVGCVEGDCVDELEDEEHEPRGHELAYFSLRNPFIRVERTGNG